MSFLKSPENVRKYFDSNVSEWDVLRYRDQTYIGRGRLALRWLAQGRPRRVLDLGCGAGHQSLAAVHQGHQVTSMDFSYEMARATRDRLAAEGHPQRVVVADALHPPFRPGSFDTVVALGLVGFVPDRPLLLRELHGLTEAGGELICDVGVPEDQVLFHAPGVRLGRLSDRLASQFPRVAKVLRRTPKNTGFYTANFTKHSPSAIHSLLRGAGFQPVASGGAGFGDLRVFGKAVVPWRVEMAISRFLNELSHRRGAGWVARHALTYVVRSVRLAGPKAAAQRAPGVLFVANFESNTGYAWNTIERVFRRVGDRLSTAGRPVFVAYPSLRLGAPTTLRGSTVSPLELDYNATGLRGIARFLQSLRRHHIKTLYLTDRPTWSARYPLFRLAGVREIVVHDRTSGERSSSPVAVWVKRLVHRVPGLGADRCIGVSDYVARRLVEVGGVPAERVTRVYNGIEMEENAVADPTALHRELGLSVDTRVVFCSGRAESYKGFQVLIEAATRLVRPGGKDVAFVYCGDGPQLPELREMVARSGLSNFHLLGKRTDVRRLLSSAYVAVVPSLWAEAFGLTVVEAMAAGVPVIGTRTGAIPELIEDGRSGLLVEPGDPAELADALSRLLNDAALHARIGGDLTRSFARTRFSIERTADEIYGVISPRGELEATEGVGSLRARNALPI